MKSHLRKGLAEGSVAAIDYVARAKNMRPRAQCLDVSIEYVDSHSTPLIMAELVGPRETDRARNMDDSSCE
jgi:hypothetical protein